MKKALMVSGTFLTMIVIACSTSHVQKTEVNKVLPTDPMRTLSADELQHGQNIFSASCARCHDLPEPNKYSQKKWTNDILPEMFVKADLDTSQQRLVQGYIFSQL